FGELGKDLIVRQEDEPSNQHHHRTIIKKLSPTVRRLEKSSLTAGLMYTFPYSYERRYSNDEENNHQPHNPFRLLPGAGRARDGCARHWSKRQRDSGTTGSGRPSPKPRRSLAAHKSRSTNYYSTRYGFL